MTRLRLTLVAAALCALVGCDGVLAEPGAGGSPFEPTDPGGGGTPTPTPYEPPDGRPVAFEDTHDTVALLPFDVRLQRVADAVGVPTDHPILAELRANRLELGDHDYAAGVAPDAAWSARRMTAWARALRPVCASDEMRARYPTLRESLEELTLAAYGRRATPEDYDAYDATLAETPASLGDDARYRAMCIALLSSTELVAR